jgi:serine protease Do
VDEITEDSGAEKGGLKKGDQLLKVDGSEIQSREALIEYLSGKSPGDVLKLHVKREKKTLDLEVELMSREKVYGAKVDRNDHLSGGPAQQSARRTGFPMVIQHETMLIRRTVGGPVFTLDGKFVGMNIAAVNRVEAFAIPSKELAEVLEGLKNK